MDSNMSLEIITNFTTTTESPNNGANQTEFDLWAVQMVSSIYLYYTPLLVFLGVIGNLVSIYVFYISKLRLQSTSQYLSALALSDTVFLLQLTPPWLSAAQITGIFHRGGFCQVFVYISYVSCCLSAWLEVSFTLERFVAVIYPLRRNAVCTVARARYVIVTIVLASLILNIPVLRFAVPSHNDCNIDREYLDHAARFNLVDTIVSFTIPLAGIVILNSWIMFGVWRLERTRRRLMKAERPRGRRRARCTRLLACQRAQQRVTRMLLIVSSVFVILNLPAYTFRVLAYAYDLNTDEIGGRWTALQQLSVMFFHTNFAINFMLYCLTGQNFRRALVQSIPWLRRRPCLANALMDDAALPPRTGSLSTSYASNNTEATSNFVVSSVTTTNLNTVHNNRGNCNRADHFITRWTFDNTRQRRGLNNQNTTIDNPSGNEAVEMRTMGGI
ncbi:neuromedin-U receptor 1-like isoform X2 [Nymphalis io]|uniref:neuromedin-U receptor 1-like isoform X2 n=1 Tax=Inachis io TaxID=171585 RepID=UPI00216A4F82|nr:neuromedin-U receptor 1-like isoform X2 [Nymphalis io]